MTPSDLLGIVSRFVHVTSAIVLVGGAIFARTVRQANLMRKFAGWPLRRLSRFFSAAFIILTEGEHAEAVSHGVRNQVLLALHVLAVGVMAARANVD